LAPEPPSTPTNLQATALSASEIELSWTASSDNVAVTGYVIYRDGVELTTVSGTATSFRDTGLDFSTRYAYSVQAIDGAGNRSPPSKPAEAITGPG
jgi:chitodextrinase